MLSQNSNAIVESLVRNSMNMMGALNYKHKQAATRNIKSKVTAKTSSKGNESIRVKVTRPVDDP